MQRLNVFILIMSLCLSLCQSAPSVNREYYDEVKIEASETSGFVGSFADDSDDTIDTMLSIIKDKSDSVKTESEQGNSGPVDATDPPVHTTQPSDDHSDKKDNNDETQKNDEQSENNNSKPTTPPTTEPPKDTASEGATTKPTDPPATEPPATEPPVTEPPTTQPPTTEPPVTEPEPTEPSKPKQCTEHNFVLDSTTVSAQYELCSYVKDVYKCSICGATNGDMHMISNNLSASQLRQISANIVANVNAYRKNNGLSELWTSGDWNSWANQRSSELAVSYGHSRPNGGSWLYSIGDCYTVGENIAFGQVSGYDFFTAFCNSGSHRATMLESSAVGIAVSIYVDSNGNAYCAMILISQY